MRSLAFLFLIVSLPAVAQSAKTTSKRPPVSQLSSKDDDDADAPAAKGAPALVADDDRALAAGLVFLFEPAPDEVRVLAIEDLALLQDPRAIEPLASLVLDPNPTIALAAVKAIALFTTPRATQVLENVVRHPRTGMPLKEAALRSLPFHRRQRARDFLDSVARGGGYPNNLKQIANESLVAFDLSQPSVSTSGAKR